MHRPFLAAVAFLILVSGCAGKSSGGASPSTSAVPATAEPAAPGADVGSVTGLVVDDELIPLAGAQVVLVTDKRETLSDESGRFTINDVPPGTHTLIAQKLGYDSKAVKVTVAAGEVTETKFELVAIDVAKESYTAIFPSVFFIVVDSWGALAQPHATQDLVCDPCETYQTIEPKPQGGLKEMNWQKSTPLPLVGESHNTCIYAKPNNDTTFGSVYTQGTSVRCDAFKAGGRAELTEAQVKLLEKVTKTMTLAFVTAGSTTLNQKLLHWMTLSYNGDIPEGFTAQPPA